MADSEFPQSYRDPLYALLDARTENKLGLPVGLLASIRLNGEKSNADQVSEASARTPYQIIPSTRKAAIDKWGIDPLINPQNASEAAGRLLKESLDRNNGDPALAAAEYHGGTDPANWGPRTKAYQARVVAGMAPVRNAALDNGFAQWMAANPASAQLPSVAPTPPGASSKDDPLAQGFGTYLQAIRAREAPIPGVAPGTHTNPDQPTNIIDKIVGTGEALLATGTGLTTGMLGMVGGALGSGAAALMHGDLGTPQAGAAIEEAAARGADELTRTPRTQSGQAQTAVIGEAMQGLLPIMPLAGEMSALANMQGPAIRQVNATAVRAAGGVQNAATNVLAKAGIGAPAAEAAPVGALGSVGSAGVDLATQRRAAATALPEPINLTTGQAGRSFEQQRFEQETAKDPNTGAPLRERYADQNEAILKNFDNFVDATGAEAPTLYATGVAVDKALVAKAARDKAEIRVKYKAAEKAGEMEDPVAMNAVVAHLNDSAPDAATAPVLDVARRRALQLGLASEDANGQLVPQAVPLKIAETYRRVIGDATNYDPTNIRQATIIKGLVDEATDGLGGNLYRDARAARARYAQQYEDRAIINSLLNNKRGMDDRSVALENVFKHSILNGSFDDVRIVRKILQTSKTAEGDQAWRELQGATMRHIRDEATKGVSTDTRGNPVVSASGLDKVVKALDKNGKLQFIFGRKGAQQVRDINDIAKVVLTSPPGSVNTSNTASVLLAALTEAGVTGSMTGIPVPVLSGLRLLAGRVKDRRIQTRVQQALGIAQSRAANTTLH